MNKIIGVATPSALATLKRQLLLVDQIAVVHDVDPQIDWTFRAKNPSLAADLDWLTARGVVFRTDFSLKFEIDIDQVSVKGEKVILKSAQSPVILSSRSQERKLLVMPKGEKITVSHMLEALYDFCCREECQRLRDNSDVEAISLFTPSLLPISGPVNTTIASVNSIVIKNLPEPDPTTSLERVLNFKDDPKTQSTFINLRRWISSLTKSNVSTIEAAQELEWLLQQYENHMRLHNLKINKGTLETILAVSGEIAESLVKLKFANLAKLPFLFSERKIALLEAELNAPGREVAYIYHTRKSFR